MASPPPSCLSTETDMGTANIPDVSAHGELFTSFIEEPPESLQMDDSLPLVPAHTQQPPDKNPKKKPSFGKKTGDPILNSWTFQRHCEQYKSFSRPLHHHSVYPRVNCGTADN
ncbi:hypothetical protein NPIL_286981 [Nephila pilipes]|uniref:Uncharacterized protein n=1 Tax=Nephila pilipes TaxID=299642 RepID=A0A8X6PC38_NEPPI|nr:hypothetical protein NPIL_286981 [Nephila pilipes]